MRLGLWWRSGLGLPLRVRLRQRALGLRLRTGSGLRLRLDGHKLHLEDERFIWADGAAIGATFAVSKVGRNEELPLGADRHELQRLGPTLDYLPNGKCGRLAALVRTVEFRAIN